MNDIDERLLDFMPCGDLLEFECIRNRRAHLLCKAAALRDRDRALEQMRPILDVSNYILTENCDDQIIQ